ncbi:MAG: glycosyltransferase family 2 protein, partial [Acidithiobacillus sp.]|nr:glycosyltransferase family 2 protein [Acidithiobacillus sp.]
MPNLSLGIILPTCNRPHFLCDAIDSIRAQDFPDWQLIVINDGGEDISSTIRKYNDKRIQLIQFNQKYGVSEARNIGLRMVTSDWVTFLDDDDLYLPGYFSYLASVADSADVLIFDSIYSSEVIVEGVRKVHDQSRPYAELPYDPELLLGGNYIPIQTVVFRRSSVPIFFDPMLEVYEDWDYLLRLCLDRKVTKISQPFVDIRRRIDRNDSATTLAGFVKWMQAFDIVANKYPSDNPKVILRRMQTRNEIITTRYVAKMASAVCQDTQSQRSLEPWLGPNRMLPKEMEWLQEEQKLSAPSLAFLILTTEPNKGSQASTLASLAAQRVAVEEYQRGAVDQIPWEVVNSKMMAFSANWIALIDAGDQLAPDASFRIQQAILAHPQWQLIYTDEDSLTADGQHVNPHCKPDFNLDYLRSLPYVGGLLIIKKELFAELGGFDPQAEGAEDYDLVLRAWERVGDAGIGHIPEVLYHRLQGGGHCTQSIEEILAASKSVLERHLQRLGIGAEVMPGPFPPATRVRYPLTATPSVSIIIPTRNQLGMLQRCVESIIEKTRYPHYEILIVDNDSDEPEARQYLDLLAAQEESLGGRLRILRHPGPFNFAAMNNRAVAAARGEFLLLLNNDTAALHEDWLDEMVSHALRPEVGVVGAKLLFPDGKIQHAGVILGMKGPAEHPFIGQPAEYRGYFGRAMLTQNLSAVTGACLLISKDLYQQVGGLDESTFQVSYNDVDLCL